MTRKTHTLAETCAEWNRLEWEAEQAELEGGEVELDGLDDLCFASSPAEYAALNVWRRRDRLWLAVVAGSHLDAPF